MPRRRAHERLAEDVGVRQLGAQRPAGERVERADAVQLVDLVLDRRSVPASLLRDRVHDDRSAQPGGAPEDLFERGLVVAVHEAGVLDAQRLENGRRLKELLEAFLDAIRRLVRGRADERQVTQESRDVLLDALVSRIDAQLRQVVGEPADGRGVRPSVVVDDDDQIGRLQVRDLVQRLVCHATGERAVADDRDDVTALLPAEARLRDPERVAERRRRVAVLDEVVLALLP